MPNQNEQNSIIKINFRLSSIQAGLYKRLNLKKQCNYSNTKRYINEGFKETFDPLKDLYKELENNPYISQLDKAEAKKKIERCQELFKQLESGFKCFSQNDFTRTILRKLNFSLESLKEGLRLRLENLGKELENSSYVYSIKGYIKNEFKESLDLVKELYEKIINNPNISRDEKSEIQQKIENRKREFNQLESRFKHFNENKNHQPSNSRIAYLLIIHLQSHLIR